MKTQQLISAWTIGLGRLLLFAVFVVCLIDVVGFSARGRLLVPLFAYIAPILTGVLMQFVGNAVSHMRFAHVNYGKPSAK